jgi:hypothetical protein
MTFTVLLQTVLCGVMAGPTLAAGSPPPPGRIISLDGAWAIADGDMNRAPQVFDHKVAVPGLVDLAKPAFTEMGSEKSGQHRQAFWYRRGFSIEGPIP